MNTDELIEVVRAGASLSPLRELELVLSIIGQELLDRDLLDAAHHVSQAIDRLTLHRHNARVRSATTEPAPGAAP